MRRMKASLRLTAAMLIVVSLFYMYKSILFPKRGLTHSEGEYVFHRSDDNKIIKEFINKRRMKNLPKMTTLPPVPQVYHKNLSRTYLYISSATTDRQAEEIFFRYLEGKEMFCKDDRRMGFQHDGGWNVCNSPPFKMRNPCLIYSFGIDDDWVFDDAMIYFFNCTVKAYDPSMFIGTHIRAKKIYFQNTGIAGDNRVDERGWRLKTFKQYLKESGHSQEIVDYLKMDVDNDEWETLKTMVNDGSLKKVKQLGFELHMKELEKKGNSTKSDFVDALNLLMKLEGLGFKKFNYRKNPTGLYKSHYSNKEHSCCYDLHYLNTNFL